MRGLASVQVCSDGEIGMLIPVACNRRRGYTPVRIQSLSIHPPCHFPSLRLTEDLLCPLVLSIVGCTRFGLMPALGKTHAPSPGQADKDHVDGDGLENVITQPSIPP